MPSATERMVLQACRDLPKDEYTNVHDDEIARETHLPLQDVRTVLQYLEGEDLVTKAELETGQYAAQITHKGILALGRAPLLDESKRSREGPRTIKVVPKGLRSFDRDDAGFFLDLLPPPRRADGLPEIIHFWKSRIENPEPDTTFRVGAIYGPSGCGKSSLVKAGLLPRLSDHVLRVYVEATPDQTESDLLKHIRWKCPELPPNLGLVETLAALHEDGGLSPGRMILLVIDQFEQWLAANRWREDTDSAKALAHCDEERVRAILMVRDDFLGPTIQFMEKIGIEFRSRLNATRVDLFTPRHAEKVLADFGRAEGILRDCLTTEQQEFVTQAVKALALQDGMIIPVRLALFFETFKSREWTTKTLQEIGDAEGVGVAFLEKTFNSDYADPNLRSHQEAAQSVLGALLPESGSQIKRPRRPWPELLDASGYASRPKLFDELLRILDKELFLITPIDQGGRLESDGGQATGSVQRYYQLTHDYLVPSLREWRSNKNQEALNLVNAIEMAETKDVPPFLKQLAGLRIWANPMLHRIIENSGVDSKERLNASLALLPVDEGQVEYLYQRLLRAAPGELPVLREALKRYWKRLVERLWGVLEQSEEQAQHLQAACALAVYDPNNANWEELGDRVAQGMVRVNARYLGTWLDALRPAQGKLTAPLAAIFRDRGHPETERSLAMDILDDYASDQHPLLADLFLADLLLESEENHFAVLFKKLRAHQEAALPLLKGEMGKSLPEATEVEKDELAKRQARAAIALVRLGQANEVWHKLRHSPDPRLRSFIVNWLAPLGANPQEIASELNRIKPVAKPTPDEGQQPMDAVLFNPETSMRRALILALGQYGEEGLSAEDRKPLIDNLLALYENDPDAGIHGAAEWTLRKWGQQESLKEKNAAMRGKEPGEHRWYVNGQGQTFALIEGPVEFRMGSPPNEPDRFRNETPHRRVIPRRFAIAAKEVTVEQFQQFVQADPEHEQYGIAQNDLDQYSSPKQGGPMNAVSWSAAAAYCDWLSKQEKIPETEWCYRLPTEAEWEYACRAGAVTSRYYGLSEELLGQYAWCLTNTGGDRARPCGRLLPNDLGLFDMLGNVFEWCNGRYEDYPDGEGRKFDDPINICDSDYEIIPRLLRGGSFSNQPAHVRSANRSGIRPAVRSLNVGFRLARTHP